MSDDAAPGRDYAQASGNRVRRVWLAIIICGFAACVLVTLVGIVWLFGLNLVGGAIFGQSLNSGPIPGPQDSFFQGLSIAGMAASFNWIFGYLTVPAAMLALGVTIGRFPRRGIIEPPAYLLWGAISGAILVAAPSVFGAFFVSSSSDAVRPEPVFGALLGGLCIGALAGVACAGLFLLIVKPKSQIGAVDASVF